MKVLVVLSFDMPEPECVPEALEAIRPQRLPHFSGQARIVVDPTATSLERWLDE